MEIGPRPPDESKADPLPSDPDAAGRVLSALFGGVVDTASDVVHGLSEHVGHHILQDAQFARVNPVRSMASRVKLA